MKTLIQVARDRLQKQCLFRFLQVSNSFCFWKLRYFRKFVKREVCFYAGFYVKATVAQRMSSEPLDVEEVLLPETDRRVLNFLARADQRTHEA